MDATQATSDVSTSTDGLSVNEKVSLNFRKQQIPTGEKDPAGKELTKEFKRPKFELMVTVPTVAGVIAALQNPKTQPLILDAAKEIIFGVLRNQVSNLIEANEKVADFTLTQDMIKPESLTLEFIAAMPKSERGSGISKDQLTAFAADYKSIMLSPEGVAAAGKARTAEGLDKHVTIIIGRFNEIRARNNLLQQMADLLDAWLTVSKNAEEFMPVYEYAKERLGTFLKAEVIDEL